MSVLKRALLLVACLLALSQRATARRYIGCRDSETGGLEQSAQLDVCDGVTGDHCPIKRGTEVTYSMAFETMRPFENATLRVSKVSFTNTYQVFDSAPACTGSGLKCPSEDGDQQRMSLKRTFPKDFPSGLRNVRFELIDENEAPIVCQQFLALID